MTQGKGDVATRWPLAAAMACGVLLPLWVFGTLAGRVLAREPFALDTAWLLFFRGHAGPAWDVSMLALSVAGSFLVVDPVALLAAAMLGWRRRWQEAAFLVLAVSGAQLLNHLAKDAVRRVRPDLWVSIAPEASTSFPSGHAMQTMALALALLLLTWPTRARWLVLVAAAVFVAGVGASRLYLGVHFPSDVLAGWCAAVAWVNMLWLALRLRRKREGVRA